MTRLTNSIRRRIVNNALDKAGITKRKVAHYQEKDDIGEAIRIQGLGGPVVIEKMKKAQKKVIALLKEFGTHATVSGIFHSSTNLRVNINGQAVYFQFSGKNNDDPYASEYRASPGYVTLKHLDPLTQRYQKWEATESKLYTEEMAMRADVMAALENVTTVKNLLKVWPEAEELLPSDMAPKPKAKLPMVRTADLNAAIGLPS